MSGPAHQHRAVDAPRIQALSIRQPWAELIVAGHKLVENRTWRTLHSGLLVIHAPAAIDKRALAALREAGTVLPDQLPTRAFLGFVTLEGIHDEHDGCCAPWGEPAVKHWTLTGPQRFAAPAPGSGAQGLFDVPIDVAATVRRLTGIAAVAR